MEYYLRFEAIEAYPAMIDKNLCAFICDYTLNGITVDKIKLWVDISNKENDLDFEFIENHMETIKDEVINPKNHDFVICYSDQCNSCSWSHDFNATIEIEQKTIILRRNIHSSTWFFFDLVESFYYRYIFWQNTSKSLFCQGCIKQ